MEIIDNKTSPFLVAGTDTINNRKMTTTTTTAINGNSNNNNNSSTTSKDRAGVASEKKPTKRHSVSRQAQQPPLVTHQHHTPPPYVSPLLHASHNHHPHHHHHKTGSLDLTHTSYGQFLQQQHRHQIQHGHMPSVGLVATQMQTMLNSKSSTDMVNMSPVHSVDHHDLSSSPSTFPATLGPRARCTMLASWIPIFHPLRHPHKTPPPCHADSVSTLLALSDHKLD